jgi:hypothetical protein
MGKDSKAPATAGATSKEVVETPVFAPEVVQEPLVVVETATEEVTPVVEETPVVEDSEKIVFVDGKIKYELTVSEFTFKGKKYASEKAVEENTDVLKALVKLNSFILKKV